MLFFIAEILAYLLTRLEPHEFYSARDYFVILPFAWCFDIILSAVVLVGIPFLVVHFWTIYHLLYTDDSRMKLFFIAFATQSAICISICCFTDSGSWVRSLISLGAIAIAYLALKKFRLIQSDVS